MKIIWKGTDVVVEHENPLQQYAPPADMIRPLGPVPDLDYAFKQKEKCEKEIRDAMRPGSIATTKNPEEMNQKLNEFQKQFGPIPNPATDPLYQLIVTFKDGYGAPEYWHSKQVFILESLSRLSIKFSNGEFGEILLLTDTVKSIRNGRLLNGAT